MKKLINPKVNQNNISILFFNFFKINFNQFFILFKKIKLSQNLQLLKQRLIINLLI